MKKLMILTLVVTVVITFSSCQAKDTNVNNNALEASKPVQTALQSQNKPEEKSVEGLLQAAFQGKIDNLPVGVGAKLQEVIAELGEPVELNNFEGTSYIAYENMNFMLDRIVESTGDQAEITGVIVSEGYEIYGVKVGMTPEEIKKVLGAAQQEYKEGEDEADMWKLEYNCGDYKLTFFFNDKTSPSTSAYLSKL